MSQVQQNMEINSIGRIICSDLSKNKNSSVEHPRPGVTSDVAKHCKRKEPLVQDLKCERKQAFNNLGKPYVYNLYTFARENAFHN